MTTTITIITILKGLVKKVKTEVQTLQLSVRLSGFVSDWKNKTPAESGPAGGCHS